MSATEYLAFIPLLIYGMAIANLLGEWRRLFDKQKRYLPYLLYTIVFTEIAIYNVFIYVEILDKVVGKPYLAYLGFLISPFLYILMVNVFTPENQYETKEYFNKNISTCLYLMAAFVASHFLFQFDEPTMTVIGRLISMGVILITAIFKRTWMIYALVGVWLILLISRLDQVST